MIKKKAHKKGFYGKIVSFQGFMALVVTIFISWKAREIGKILNYMLDGPGKMSMKTMQGILMENFIDPKIYRNKFAQITFIDDVGNLSHINDAANLYVI